MCYWIFSSPGEISGVRFFSPVCEFSQKISVSAGLETAKINLKHLQLLDIVKERKRIFFFTMFVYLQKIVYYCSVKQRQRTRLLTIKLINMEEYHLDWWRIAEEQRIAQKTRRRAKTRAAIKWSVIVIMLSADVAMWAEFVHICKTTTPLYATEETNNNQK